ncbi:MAG: hypothetical protein RQ715_06060 [Methylococcales bacterium]|nr:hypothetical protein [Methylococcales bacterium]
MKKHFHTPFAAALGATLLSTAAMAENGNPFALTELDSGYLQLAESDKGAEMACGEGKCGGNMGGATKAPEGNCAKKKDAGKAFEGACGEGQCGAAHPGKNNS